MSENHVIPVVFNATQTIRTRVVYQYDYGQELHFVNFQGLPNVFEVHFSNSKTGEATIQIGTDNRVTVPDIYLTNPSACYAWVFLHDTETDGETKYVIEIPIQQRAQGVDGEVTPVQQSTVTQAIAVLNEAVEQTSLAQESAEAARDAAESAAETTGGYAEQAQAHAENASASENAAANSAQNAADEASRAQTSEINAANSASAAEESAQASAQSAASSENDARAAYAFAEQTEASAGNAERSASQAASILGETEAARDQAVSAQAAAETAVGQYNAMTATANILPEGSQPTAEIDHSGQNPVLNLGIPKGDKGDDYVLTDGDKNDIAGLAAELVHIPTNVSAFTNDAGYLTAHQDISNKADKSEIPTNISQLENDSGYLTSETDPTVPEWAKQAQKPIYTAIEVGALPSNTHIPSTTTELTNDAGFITAANLPTNVSELNNDAGYLTQHQDISGKADKTEIPTKVSDLTNDSGYLTAETDPTVPAWAKASTKPSYTAAEVGATTQQQVNSLIADAIGDIHSFDLSIVQTLPVENISTHTIYLVPKTGETNDVYDEYVYINGGWEMIGNTQIDLSNYVQKTDYATSDTPGVVKPSWGTKVSSTGDLSLTFASIFHIKGGTDTAKPISAGMESSAAFYGLAKAAGDTTQSASNNDVGAYTDEAKTAIQTMLDVPAKTDIPEVPVQDVQVNGVSVLQGGVANVPVATRAVAGVVKHSASSNIKAGTDTVRVISPANQHESTFYGLAKAAGADMKDIANTTVGIYPDAQKEAIQSMLGISQMLAPINPNLVATQAYAIGDVFAANGHLYKATAAIAQDEAIIPDTNCVETTMAEAGGKIKDVQVAGTSVVGSDGVANILAASLGGDYGTVKLKANTASSGLTVGTDGTLAVAQAQPQNYHVGTSSNPMSVYYMNYATFYGLARAAGQINNINATGGYNSVGQYTEEAKSAIKSMLGVQDGLKVVRLI